MSLWRLDQNSEAADDFLAEMKIRAPAGRNVSKITLHLADVREPAPIAFSKDHGDVVLRTTVRSRASWLVIEFK